MAVENTQKAWWKPAMEMFVVISGWIVAPILLGLYLGRWLDGRFGTESKYLIICVAVAFVVTNVGLVLTVIKTAKKMEEEARKDKITKNG